MKDSTSLRDYKKRDAVPIKRRGPRCGRDSCIGSKPLWSHKPLHDAWPRESASVEISWNALKFRNLAWEPYTSRHRGIMNRWQLRQRDAPTVHLPSNTSRCPGDVVFYVCRSLGGLGQAQHSLRKKSIFSASYKSRRADLDAHAERRKSTKPVDFHMHSCLAIIGLVELQGPLTVPPCPRRPAE